MDNNKPQAVVELLRMELIHDIEFESWKISKTRIDNATMQERLQADFEADDWLERQIEGATDDIFSELSFCLDEHSFALRDTLDVTPAYTENNFPYDNPPSPDEMVNKPTKYTFHFTFDEDWKGSVRALRTGLHRFVVYTVLARWFELVKPDEVAAYQAKADGALARLNSESRTDTVNVRFTL